MDTPVFPSPQPTLPNSNFTWNAPNWSEAKMFQFRNFVYTTVDVGLIPRNRFKRAADIY